MLDAGDVFQTMWCTWQDCMSNAFGMNELKNAWKAFEKVAETNPIFFLSW